MFCMYIFLSVCISASPTCLLLRLCQRFVVYLAKALRLVSVYHAAFRVRSTPSKNKAVYSTGTGLQGHGIIRDHHIVSLRYCLFGLSVPPSDKISVTVLWGRLLICWTARHSIREVSGTSAFKVLESVLFYYLSHVVETLVSATPPYQLIYWSNLQGRDISSKHLEI